MYRLLLGVVKKFRSCKGIYNFHRSHCACLTTAQEASPSRKDAQGGGRLKRTGKKGLEVMRL